MTSSVLTWYKLEHRTGPGWAPSLWQGKPHMFGCLKEAQAAASNRDIFPRREDVRIVRVTEEVVA